MRRVVVTGMGIVSSIGANAQEVLTSLREGKSGIVAAPQYAERGMRCQVHGEPQVKPEDVEEARKHGATDRDIHDTVLIAATFSMFNRYVDGLASLTPTDPKAYEEMGKRMSAIGYVMPKPALR